MTAWKPSLAVLTSVHSRGWLLAKSLELVRPLADEIVVAFDSRTPRDNLGPLEAVADKLIGFEFSEPNRFRPWLREQTRCDWLLLLDSDECASTALLEQIPELISRRDMAGYQSQFWWLYPTHERRLTSQPWGPDRIFRLVRNDGRLKFPGLKHTGAQCPPPFRLIDGAVIHLDLLLRSEQDRRAKVDLYDRQKYPLFTAAGALINHAYYLPELRADLQTEVIPEADRRNVRRILDTPPSFAAPARDYPVEPARNVERWWSGGEFDYRCALLPGEYPASIPASARFEVRVKVTNTGQSVWPSDDVPNQISLAYHWRDQNRNLVLYDGIRSPLPSRVLPGETITMIATVDAPRTSGKYTLQLDLVRELIRWFDADTEITIDVEAGPFENLAPGKLISLPAARAFRQRCHGVDALQLARMSSSTRAPKAGYELDEEGLNHVIERIKQGGCRRVLEFGSGDSTVALAQALDAVDGHLLSIDQAPVYAERAANALRDRQLANRATVRVAPLSSMETAGITTLCYDLGGDVGNEIRAFEPDLVVIDGPSQASGASRLAVGPALLGLIAKPAIFVLDDAFRDSELDVAERWQATPGITVDGILPTGQGLLIGSLRPLDVAAKKDGLPGQARQ